VTLNWQEKKFVV